MPGIASIGRRSALLTIGGFATLAVLALGFGALRWASGGGDLLQPVPSLTYAFAGNHLHGIAYVPEAGLYLASHYGLFLLRDGELFQVGESRDDFMGFSRHPHKPDVFFASGHPQTGGNTGVIVSRDGGASWKQVFRGLAAEVVDFHSMVVSPAVPDRLYGVHDRRLYVGDLASGNWRFAAARGIELDGLCWGVPCLAAAAEQPDHLFAATPSGLYVSEDAGESWHRVSAGTGAIAGLGAHPEHADLLFAYTEAHGVARSGDGGRTWVARNTGVELPRNDFIFGFAFVPGTTQQVFAASAGGLVFETNDAGASWRRVLTAEGGPN